jgi:hypothetical protein
MEIKMLGFSIGGYFGTNYSIEIAHDQLDYQAGDSPCFVRQKPYVVNLEKSALSLFKSELERLEVLSWEKEYFNPGVCDGTQWDLEYNIDGKRGKKFGSNAYPGQSEWESSFSPTFIDFLRALNSLIGEEKGFSSSYS